MRNAKMRNRPALIYTYKMKRRKFILEKVLEILNRYGRILKNYRPVQKNSELFVLVVVQTRG